MSVRKKKIPYGVKQESLLRNTWKNRTLVCMVLPVVILLILFNYIPMFGLLVAFKDFNYTDGILHSPWVGFQNFKFLFSMKDLTIRMLRNTVGYYLLFTAVGTVLNVALALGLNQCRNKYFTKYSHAVMILPTFISFIAVTYIVECFLNHTNGILNGLLQTFGNEPVRWYAEAKYWPLILTIVNVWKGTGYGAVLYLSALSGIDGELYEAADLDGATGWQKVKYIDIPMLVSMICIVTLMGVGGIMSSNTGLFYQVTKDSSMLYETTQTIDTYVLKTLVKSGLNDFGPSTAVTMFQSVVGCIACLAANAVTRRVSPENALF
nr:ABC transporter permease subunit [uncultured Acetatifactor sp.]